MMVEAGCGLEWICTKWKANNIIPLSEGQSVSDNRLTKAWIIMIIPNAIAVVFLGCIWQAGGIKSVDVVSSLITNRLQSSPHFKTSKFLTEFEPKVFQVHYLTDCHQLPEYSHFQIGYPINITSLDCSPVCRRTKETSCESFLFQEDPLGWIKREYLPVSSDIDALPLRNMPDYIITNQILVMTFFSSRGYKLENEDGIWHTFDEKYYTLHKHGDRDGEIFEVEEAVINEELGK